MNRHSQLSSQNADLARFKIRLTARLCIIFIALSQVLSRVIFLSIEPGISNRTQLFYGISAIIYGLMSIIVIIEYISFRKIGPRIVKHSKKVEFLLLVLLTAEWLFNTYSGLSRTIQTPTVAAVPLPALFGFVGFGYRALLVLLITQDWRLQVTSSVLALGMVTGYIIYWVRFNIFFSVFRGVLLMVYMSMLYYFENKIKWNMLFLNLRQEKWIQVNDFILNNIPENIMILDLDGRAQFISDYCKLFLEKCHLSIDTRELFHAVQDLREQFDTSPSTPSLSHDQEIQDTVAIRIEAQEEQRENEQNVESLIEHFKRSIKEGLIIEKQFLVYNGKLKVETHSDKSIELKISYIRQFEREHIILILRDTTKRDLLATLEETNKYKDQLLASVSHELRAPLNGNINLVEGAVNSPMIPDKIKESLLIPALRSSKFLLHLINDFLDMSQIKEKKLRLNFQSGDLKETLKSTLQLVELQAKKKEIELQVELDPGLPRKFSTDHVRLSQIVLNLLNNAIKFTQSGTVKLAARVMENNTKWIKISIQDSGIGMNQENLGKLFSTYTHIEFEERKIMNPSGVGLGLKIASNLADLLPPDGQHGISVESLPGKGSTFTFIIENKQSEEDRSHEIDDEPSITLQPRVSCKIQTYPSTTSILQPLTLRTESEALLESSACRCPRILIVDDNPFNTMAFETILGTLDVRCESVFRGPSAIKKLLNFDRKKCGLDCKLYSTVFMDQEMPEMSGVETVKEIRRLQKESQIPNGIKIIGCTAHKSGEEVDKFMAAGLEKCIHKPISASMIKDLL